MQGLKAGVNAVYTDEASKRRYEILCREVFARFKALLVEPSALAYAERHDNLERLCPKTAAPQTCAHSRPPAAPRSA